MSNTEKNTKSLDHSILKQIVFEITIFRTIQCVYQYPYQYPLEKSGTTQYYFGCSYISKYRSVPAQILFSCDTLPNILSIMIRYFWYIHQYAYQICILVWCIKNTNILWLWRTFSYWSQRTRLLLHKSICRYNLNINWDI